MLLKNYKFSDSEVKQLIKSMVILVDTREKEIQHITQEFQKKGIAWKTQKLDFADFSFLIPANNSLGIARDIYFDRQISIERKNSLEELSGNLGQDRARFESELLRKKGKFILLVEGGCFDNIIGKKYSTQLNNNSFLASLFSFENRYNIRFIFGDKRNSWRYIYLSFVYFLKEWVK